MKKLLLVSAFFCGSYFVNAQCAIVYVAPDGNPTASGLMDSPKSIEAAFLTTPEGTLIRLAAGLYEIETPLVIQSNDIVVEGGFLADENWTKTSLPGATTILRKAIAPQGAVNQQRLVAMSAVDKSGFELHDLTIQTEDAYLPGMSTYGLYLSNCSSYRLVRCKIDAGNAANGADGEVGEDGLEGDIGEDGKVGAIDTNNVGPDGGVGGMGAGVSPGNGGIAGVNPSGSNDPGGPGGEGDASGDYRSGGGGGGGGAGGEGNNPGGAGGTGGGVDNGDPQTGGGGGGTGGDPGGPGGDGNPGANGAPGSLGAIGSTYQLDEFFIPGGPGENGGDGQGGKGGVGGGGGGGQGCFFCINGSANSGGGGGGGGQGATGGTGGLGGGASFGVYVHNNGAGAALIDCKVNVGTPGMGGAGGAGGVGGEGGEGGIGPAVGIDEVGAGGNGGKGGKGGDGGNGGSGRMGVASAVELASGEAFTVLSTNFNLEGQPEIRLSYSECVGTDISVTVENVDLDEGDDVTTWNFGPNGTPSTGTANPQSVAFSSDGFYNIVNGTNTYRAFAYYCCASFVGLSESDLSNLIVYPNPTEGKVTVSLPDYAKELNITITDLSGKQVYNANYTNTQKETIEFEGATGSYMLTVSSELQSKTYKLIKQ